MPTVTGASLPPPYLLPLLQLCDSALPTGAFNHSFGLETYLTTGVVHDEESLLAWLEVYLARQLAYCDGLAIRLVDEALDGGNLDVVWELDRAVTAQALPSQLRAAGATMGRRVLEIGSLIEAAPALVAYRAELDAGRCHGHQAIAFALVTHAVGVPLSVMLPSYLFTAVASLTQNAVRGIPIGQNAGQRVQRRMHEPVAAAVGTIMELTPQDLGAVAPGLEVSQMRHERQHARMFMS